MLGGELATGNIGVVHFVFCCFTITSLSQTGQQTMRNDVNLKQEKSSH